MLSITFFQMRKNIGRLAAAGVAILIGTAFVAATFIAGQLLIATTENQMTAPFSQAELVIPASYQDAEGQWQYQSFDDADRSAVAEVEGVKAVSGQPNVGVSATFGDKIEYTSIALTNDDPDLVVPRVDSGTAPATATEVALDSRTAERMGAGVGDTVTLSASGDSDSLVSMTVSGLTSDPAGVFAATSGSALVSYDGFLELIAATPADSDMRSEMFQTLTLTLEPSATVPAVVDQLTSLLDGQPTLTPSQYAERQLGSLTGQANILTTIVLMFAAIAMFVAGLVISNTFQVLVAQRAHTLALLRCVGANKRQIRNSVLIEAFILGVASSVAGIVVGIGLIQGVLMVLTSMELSTAIPTTVTIPATAVFVPLVVGTLVTVLAALVPARIATKVSPLAALRPQEGAGDSGKKVGIGRIIVSALFLATGGALLAGGLVMGGDDSSLEIAVAMGVLGGALTFIGLITSSMLWMPRVVSSVGKLFNPLGAPAKLASANTMRNPRRTAATSTALFIGVTLVAMLSVGAATTRATLNNELDEQYPLDITVEQYAGENQGPRSSTEIESTLQRVRAIDGVSAITHGQSTWVSTTYGSGTSLVESGDAIISVDPETFDTVLRDASLAGSLSNDRILVSRWSNINEIGDSMKVFLSPAPDDDGNTPPLTEQPGYSNAVELTPTPGIGTDGHVVTTDTMAKILETDPRAQSFVQDMYFIKVEDVNGAGDTVAEIREVFAGTDTNISGAVLEREMFQQAIDVMLLVLVGLLGVAVLIALIGVANTLSLSVIERRRESATLRAVGMSRRQLKRSLGMEGMLIAGIGALVGVVVGAIYAWLGTQLLFGGFATPDFTVRFLDIALIMVVSVGAGLLASIAPARGAAKTSPVAALAVE